MWYRFEIDNRPAGPWRRSWILAAFDAVAAGYAVWVGPGTIKIDDNQGAEIREYKQ